MHGKVQLNLRDILGWSRKGKLKKREKNSGKRKEPGKRRFFILNIIPYMYESI